MHHRLDVGAHHGQLGGRVRSVDRAHGGEPGVVDQNVDDERTGGELFNDGGPGCLVGQIGHDPLGPHAVPRAQLAGQLLERGLATGDQGHAETASGQQGGDLGADPG